MFKWLEIVLRTLRSMLRTRQDLALENLVLCQQLAVLKHRHPRPRLTDADRLFWVALSRIWPGWHASLHIVQPETVVRWHRQGFRYYWRWKSRHRGRPKIDPEIRGLIRRMCLANPLWGAPRIHGELLKLGIDVSEATVSKYWSDVEGHRLRRGGHFSRIMPKSSSRWISSPCRALRSRFCSCSSS